MVCVPQAEDQQLLEAERVPGSEAAGAAAAVGVEEVVAEEERTASCVVHDHTRHSTQSGPITIFVKEGATVDALYAQIAAALNLPELEFEVNLKSEVLNRSSTLKLGKAGIRFEGDRNLLTLTSVPVKSSKKYILPITKGFSEEETPAASLPSTSDAPATQEKRFVGLVNQAMTCYLNSLLQSLFMTPEFRNALYKWEFDSREEEARRKSIPFQLQRLFLRLQTSPRAAVETTELTRSFGWDSSDSWTQHDVQELCRVMFDALEHKFRKTEQADLINTLYQGKMNDYVKCMECKKENIREDTFLDIPLPIRPFGKETAFGSVEEALEGFVAPETLDGANQYACDNCGKKCDAQKGLKLVHAPYLLTLHLMRFDFDYNSLHRLKLNDKVVFPEILDMNPFVSTNTKDLSKTVDSADVDTKKEEVQKEGNDDTKNKEEIKKTEDEGKKNEVVEVKKDEEVKLNDVKAKNNVEVVKKEEEVKENEEAAKNNVEEVKKEVEEIKKDEEDKKNNVEVAKKIEEEVKKNEENVSKSVPEEIKKEVEAKMEVEVTNEVGATPGPPPSDGDTAQALPPQTVTNNTPEEVPLVNGKTKENGTGEEGDSERNERNARLSTGPYVYELYAILIHSGNASGGHYYAYIKDFASGHWFCFNDQTVTRITSDDIKKTYGGSRSYYNSGFSPSTSAYMLMYRQIDKVRNAQAIQPEDFPAHIKALLVAMAEGGECGVESVKAKVYCYLPQADRHTHCKLNCLASASYDDLLQMAHKELNIEAPIEQCRLVAYDSTTHQITAGLDESLSLADTVAALDGNTSFLLQIKTSTQSWTPFQSGDAVARVFVVDVEEEKVSGPLLIPVRGGALVADFKAGIGAEGVALPPSPLAVVLEKFTGESLSALADDVPLFDADVYATSTKKVYVGSHPPPDTPFDSSKLCRLIDRFQNIINLYISMPDIETEDLEEQEIPLLSAANRAKEPVAMEEEDGAAEAVSVTEVGASEAGAAAEEAASTDASASEDSSLTDSDRTLVGEQESALAPLSSPSDGSPHALSSPDDPPPPNNTDEDNWSGAEMARSSHTRPQNLTFFKATPYEEGSSKMLRVEVDKRASMAWLKRQLEAHVGVPCDYFKVVKSNDEYDYSSLSPSFRDGDRIAVRLGRALKKGEYPGKLFKLTPNDPDPIKFLMNCTLSNGMLVADAKRQILKDLQRKHNLEISFERCRLRKKSWKNPGQVYYDHQKFEEAMCLMSNWELFLQELPEGCEARALEEPLPELVLFVRRFSPSSLTIGPFEEIELPSAAGNELHAKLSEMSGVPAENIEIAKALGSFPCDVSVLTVNAELEWTARPTPLNEWPFNIYEDGHVLLYKDGRESVKELSAEERREVERAENGRRPRAAGWTFTPRKERGLRIYLDPTPPKSAY